MSRVLQNLNVLVLASPSYVTPNLDDPNDPNSVEDPSSPGPPDSWGSGILLTFPGFPWVTPPTGQIVGTRAPPGAPNRRRVRDKGSAIPPNKNTLTNATAWQAKRCFAAALIIRCTKPAPDPSFFTGQTFSFVGTLCAPYAPPVIASPTTSLVFKTLLDIIMPGGAGTIPLGTLLPDAAAKYLWGVVGHDSFGVVTSDLVSLPSPGNCTGDPCTAIIPASLGGTGVGAVIPAAP